MVLPSSDAVQGGGASARTEVVPAGCYEEVSRGRSLVITHHKQYYCMDVVIKILYSLNISREKIFADFEVFDLPQKFYPWPKLITCGTCIWLVFALMSCYSIINL